MSYLRFLSSELALNPFGREISAMVAAIHWAKGFSEDAFVGEPKLIEGDLPESTTVWEDTRQPDEGWDPNSRYRFEGRTEFREEYPNGYSAVRVVSDNSYWYVCGPVEVMRLVAEAMGYPVETVT